MVQARYSIGIDLGTTSSALSFVPLDGQGETELFFVPQWDSHSGMVDLDTLPSFLYRPDAATADRLLGKENRAQEWVVGQLARKKIGETPGRVAHSAKSWLCHHSADRSTPFLPWASEEVQGEEALSPIDASSLILTHLRQAWDRRFARAGADFRFDRQIITITVPASFDAAAQELTLLAARKAGFPEQVRLLEEPQAAFYRWLESHIPAQALWEDQEEKEATLCHVLVVDVGGGTSDFSLFQMRRQEEGRLPVIERLAVSDHILLGGDNIDIALAHLIEPRLTHQNKGLSGHQWDHLVARCRDLKERVLSETEDQDRTFSVSIPGRGSSLMAQSLTAKLSWGEIQHLLLEGFFPACEAGEKPHKAVGALKEWGLPYAYDSAVTRHLSGFLAGRPAVDAVLFNGGTLQPQGLRDRLRTQMGVWQAGRLPLVLDNPQPIHAVARGAAHFGRLLQHNAQCIEAGTAHPLFLEVQDKDPVDKKPTLVCILPKGAAPDQHFVVDAVNLALRVNQPVRFQCYYSTQDHPYQTGAVVPWQEEVFHRLPPLETLIKMATVAPDPQQTVAVTLQAALNALGILKLSCLDKANPHQVWPLTFAMRPQQNRRHVALSGMKIPMERVPEANVSADLLAAAQAQLIHQFRQPLSKKNTLTPKRVLKTLEELFEQPKNAWNWVVVRSFWPVLAACMPDRGRSIEREETWLILAGYFLRPGFGASLDGQRMDGVWKIRETGLCFPSKRIRLQEQILWRRVAGGLSRDRQERLLKKERNALLKQANPSAELVRLAGSLERIGPEYKVELIERFLHSAVDLLDQKKDASAYLTALKHLLNRTPLYAGPETVVSPEWVERAFQCFKPYDWTADGGKEMEDLFLWAARLVDNRSVDLPTTVRHSIIQKLEKSGAAAVKVGRLHRFSPVLATDCSSLYEEALPPGLILQQEE